MLAGALPQLVAGPENPSIIAATRSFVAANGAITKFKVTVEKVEKNFARARVTPQRPGATDPAWVFLEKKQGKWTGLAMGTSFDAKDYQKLGIPKSLRVD